MAFPFEKLIFQNPAQTSSLIENLLLYPEEVTSHTVLTT